MMGWSFLLSESSLFFIYTPFAIVLVLVLVFVKVTTSCTFITVILIVIHRKISMGFHTIYIFLLFHVQYAVHCVKLLKQVQI